MAAYEVLLLNTAVPQIQAAQSGDTYVVPRDIAFSAALTLSAGTANGVPYLNGSKVLTTGSALTFDGTNLGVANGSVTAGNSAVVLTGKFSSGFPTSGAGYFQLQTNNSDGTNGGLSVFTLANGTLRESYRIVDESNAGGCFQAWNVAGSEQMRLTSTGLGIGTSSPGAKLHAYDTSNSKILSQTTTGYAQFQASSTSGDFHLAIDNSTGAGFGSGAYSRVIYSTGAYPLVFSTNAAEKMRLDASGNLGLGVTPSAWGNEHAAFQIGFSGAIQSYKAGTASEFTNYLSNAYNDNTNWRYIRDGAATRYQQTESVHQWYTAPSGTAGNTITFTQAMTLDASGNLTIGNSKNLYFNDSGTGIYGEAGGSGLISFTTNGSERARITSVGNFKIGGTADRATTEGTNQLVLFNGTAPVGTLTNGVSFYSESGEARVMDAAGNSTLLSPHDTATNEWIFHSKHTPTGKVLRIDVERLLKFVNDHFGLDAVHEFIEE